jgi:fused signal recognition particle receptor
MKLNIRFGQKLRALFEGPALFGAKKDAEQLFGEIEELLIGSDFGFEFTAEILDALRKESSPSEREPLTRRLKEILKGRMAHAKQPPAGNGLSVYLVFGVNGSGKTTTVGKLAHKLKRTGRKVLIAAADTYRDAAIDQLLIWAKRADVPVVRQQQGSDPAAVVYDACESAAGRGVDDLLIDTAGRLHTKEALMEELAKIGRILDKKLPDAPKVKLLTLDATTGQNALSQTRLFNEYIGVDWIILTKLDSSSKGGIACVVSGRMGIPILYTGVGEKIEDLEDFDADEYLDLLFS